MIHEWFEGVFCVGFASYKFQSITLGPWFSNKQLGLIITYSLWGLPCFAQHELLSQRVIANKRAILSSVTDSYDLWCAADKLWSLQANSQGRKVKGETAQWLRKNVVIIAWFVALHRWKTTMYFSIYLGSFEKDGSGSSKSLFASFIDWYNTILCKLFINL